jgi:glycosyltransferase involved in cell wall biosynthesis
MSVISLKGKADNMPDAPVILLWDNFGPLHIDRINAVASRFSGKRDVIGIELCGGSDTYDWDTGTDGNFRKETLFPDCKFDQIGTMAMLRSLVRASGRIGKGTYVLCHWNAPGIFLAAVWLRLTGRRVYTMGCSKFDDKPRSVIKEAIKSLMFLPYQGALGSGNRSLGYFRFLGLRGDRVTGEYNTVSLDRIRTQAQLSRFQDADPAEGPDQATRGFLCVARLVPKKNLSMLLDAYALYLAQAHSPRPLDLCGSGPLEADLKAQSHRLGIENYVTFSGFVQSDEISRRLINALALLLPSVEEQFGNVVPEAQAMGLPVILSDNAGARDKLVRTAQSGFVIEPDNPQGLAWYMAQLSDRPELWQRMRVGAFAQASLGDVARFADGIARLVAWGEGKGGDS